MSLAWLAAALFPTQVRIAVPAEQVAVVAGKLIAVARDGKGSVLVRGGDGTFRVEAGFTAGHNASSIAVADVDGDVTLAATCRSCSAGQRGCAKARP